MKRKQKPLTLPVVTAELREKVLTASNQVKKRLAQVMRSSASSAEQPVRDIGSPGTEPPSKRLRAAEPERSKRELERAPGEDGQEKKQKRLTAFFQMQSSAVAMSVETDAEERETRAPIAEPRRKQRDMLQLSKELQKYRAEQAGALDMEEEIKQSARLRNWPPCRSMLRTPEIRCLYGEAMGSLRGQNYGASEHARPYARACDRLEWLLAQKLMIAEPLCAENFPALKKLQEMCEKQAEPVYGKDAVLASMGQTAVLNNLYDNVRKRMPQAVLRSLCSDAFFAVQMLVCIELPGTKLEEVPGPLHIEEMLAKVRQHREEVLHASAEARAEGFMLEDVQQALRAFASSHSVAARWLRRALRLKREDVLEEKLGELTETFVSKMVRLGAGYTPALVAAVAVVYHVLPATKLRQGLMVLGPAVRLLANSRGECGKCYCDAEACGADVALAANRMPAYWRRLQGLSEQPASEDDAAELNSLAVASPPVMCWICGEGFLNNGSLQAHCEKHHGDYAEYRKRLFWRAQRDGFMPMLPWVKRHILQAATFHLAYSVPGAETMKWSHPDSFKAAMPRAEVACVVCARRDWIEQRLRVYLWREADGVTQLTELTHGAGGNKEMLTCGGHLCFGNRDVINEYLDAAKYAERMPMLPKEHLYASSVIHPESPSMSWLLHTRRVPMQENSRQPRESGAVESGSDGGAGQPVGEACNCAGVGDPNELAWICYDCANCLCKPDELIEMPEYALANLLFLGRLPALLQKHDTLGLRMLLSLGRPCFRKLLLGRGAKEERESGLLGNHVLLSQPAAKLDDVLPPSGESLSNSFVALFGNSPEEVAKCQILKVHREAYVALVRERAQVNPFYHAVVLDAEGVAKLPEDGVPPQLLDCACPLLGSERYRATRVGPGSIRDPMDQACDAEEASDEEAPEEEQGTEDACGAEQPVQEELNQRETPLGLDPTATPSYVQHLAAFQAQLRQVEEACRASQRLAERKAAAGPDEISAATASAAAEEVLERKIVDLRLAAQELAQTDFEAKAKELEGVDSGLFVPSQCALSMFDPGTWTKCFPQFWFGDALPNMDRPRRITFEEIFLCLLDREELEYALDGDEEVYTTRPKSRFDEPDFVLVAGDTLRRLLMFRGTRIAFKRKGYQKDVALIAKASSEMCREAYENLIRPGGDRDGCRVSAAAPNLNAERLVGHEAVPKELQTALRQMLISTKDVPFTDGSKRSLRHEGHALNIAYGSLVVFATYNFADGYSPVLFQLLKQGEEASGPVSVSAEQPAELRFDLSPEAPDMPTLQNMHKLIAQSPRAQSKFFLLMDDIVDIYLMGFDHSLYGRHHVRQSFHQSAREDTFASTAVPALGGYGIAGLEGMESQERGFQHGHRKNTQCPPRGKSMSLSSFESGARRCCTACWKQ